MWIQSIRLPTNCRACPLHLKDRRAGCVSLPYHNLLSCLGILGHFCLLTWLLEVHTGCEKEQILGGKFSWSILSSLPCSDKLVSPADFEGLPILFNLKCFISQGCWCCLVKKWHFSDIHEPRELGVCKNHRLFFPAFLAALILEHSSPPRSQRLLLLLLSALYFSTQLSPYPSHSICFSLDFRTVFSRGGCARYSSLMRPLRWKGCVDVCLLRIAYSNCKLFKRSPMTVLLSPADLDFPP